MEMYLRDVIATHAQFDRIPAIWTGLPVIFSRQSHESSGVLILWAETFMLPIFTDRARSLVTHWTCGYTSFDVFRPDPPRAVCLAAVNTIRRAQSLLLVFKAANEIFRQEVSAFSKLKRVAAAGRKDGGASDGGFEHLHEATAAVRMFGCALFGWTRQLQCIRVVELFKATGTLDETQPSQIIV